MTRAKRSSPKPAAPAPAPEATQAVAEGATQAAPSQEGSPPPEAPATSPAPDSGVQAEAVQAAQPAVETEQAPPETASDADEPLQLRITSARAPYRRGGLRFASNRTPVVVGLRSGLSEDQFLRLDQDTAITIEIVRAETGQAVTVPRGLLAAIVAGDEAAGQTLSDLQASLFAPTDSGKVKA